MQNTPKTEVFFKYTSPEVYLQQNYILFILQE